jgi:hypothetical protein
VAATKASFGGLDAIRTPGLHTGDWHFACFRARLLAVMFVFSRREHLIPYKDDAHVGGRVRNASGPCSAQNPVDRQAPARQKITHLFDRIDL